MSSAAAGPRYFLRQARDEAFDNRLYHALAGRARDEEERALLEQLAGHERRHLEFWARLAGVDADRVPVPTARLRAVLLWSRVLGNAFTIRRLERQEDRTITEYERLLASGELGPADEAELRTIVAEEKTHEKAMERRVRDERLVYLGAAVLGLNDALIELTGGLTGLVSSISDTRLIGFTGLVIGLAASLSMAASNFLSAGMSAGAAGLRPGKAAAYTGTAYLIVVVALVAPFFAFSDRAAALVVTWVLAIGVIAAFAYYSSILQGVSYGRRFGQMLALGLGVAVITFTIGRVVSEAFDISA